jgi:hypothetical protein
MEIPLPVAGEGAGLADPKGPCCAPGFLQRDPSGTVGSDASERAAAVGEGTEVELSERGSAAGSFAGAALAIGVSASAGERCSACVVSHPTGATPREASAEVTGPAAAASGADNPVLGCGAEKSSGDPPAKLEFAAGTRADAPLAETACATTGTPIGAGAATSAVCLPGPVARRSPENDRGWRVALPPAGTAVNSSVSDALGGALRVAAGPLWSSGEGASGMGGAAVAGTARGNARGGSTGATTGADAVSTAVGGVCQEPDGDAAASREACVRP